MSAPASESNGIMGHKNDGFKEEQIPVPWGHISGKWWGPTDVQPIVALHGWQDNAGTFDCLAPLISEEAILCIDLPGHGYSSHHPEGQFYYVFWDGVIVLRRLVKHYKWDKVKLMGHSLGGAISFLYAAAYPDEVEFLICLDIASPNVRNITHIANITGDHIDRYLKYECLTPESIPCYEYDEMINIVLEAYKGDITRESAEILMRRGMQPASKPGFYHFSRDPRLKVSMLGMLSMDLVMAFAARIKCNYLNIRAVPGYPLEQPENYDKVMNQIKLGAKKFVYKHVEGSHHVHLNNPERIAPIIQEFLSTL
ncbi:probable serine hydrolase isoform X2 [Cephus cinctus]|uniref:Probable serine hydrolase isoform X2 n=1 Tax=Cephus cinctus TaxID=211228 RepID=A0AAJ7RQC1_CEPCN|nr:probable serine hydrolase isoform X2 [Cephus cinctus]